MPGTSDVSRWRAFVPEIVAALGTMALFLAWCPSIHVNPMVRMGQVSGLASLQLRFGLIAIPLIAMLVIAARVRDGRHFELASRIACASFAGLASAFVAGGIIVALHGTPYGLNAHVGDAYTLAVWANSIQSGHGELPPAYYPPLFPHLLSWYMGLSDLPALYAFKHLQIGLTAIGGPLAYLCWRRLLRPGWALGIGVIATLVVIEPYKPYEFLVLVLLVPIVVSFMQALRDAEQRTIQALCKAGIGFGIAFGVLLLSYSGWFKWSAPGVVVAAVCVTPWRGGRWKSATLLAAVTTVVLVAVAWTYVTDTHAYTQATGTSLFSGNSKQMVADDYITFDTMFDPAYFAIWKSDLAGPLNPMWPPPGELAGVGVYQVALFVGFAIAIAFARRRTPVITVACLIASAWMLRFYYAHYLYSTKLVQLYPRTSIELAFCFVVMAGFGIHGVVDYLARKDPDTPLRTPAALIGAVGALALTIGTAGSAITDRYMPVLTTPYSWGWLAYNAHIAYQQHTPPDPP